LDNKVHLTLSIFRTIRFNVDNLTLVSGELVVTQTPEQRVDGLDLDFRAQPLAGWFILGAWSWMNPIYSEPSPEDSWLKGQQLSGTPKRTGRLWSSYEIQEGAWRGWGFGLGLRHRDKITTIFRDGPPNSLGIIPGYTVWDAGIFYRANLWDLRLNLKNLSDQTYWSYGMINAAVPGEGRNMTIDFRYRF
jgi:iron complex outermembrane receptor protein